MRLIIAGSRDLDDRHTVAPFIDAYVKAQGSYPAVILSGACSGVDAIGEWWASHYGTPVERYPADWDKHGKAAGPVRNAKMVANADALLVIHWKGSRGSADVRRQAEAAGLAIVDVELVKPAAQKRGEQGRLWE
jgi:hypothetical protein